MVLRVLVRRGCRDSGACGRTATVSRLALSLLDIRVPLIRLRFNEAGFLFSHIDALRQAEHADSGVRVGDECAAQHRLEHLPDETDLVLSPAASSTIVSSRRAELSDALTTRTAGLRRRKTSREALEKLVKRGIATVDVLDAIVKPRLEAQPELLAAWSSVKRPTEPGGGPSSTSSEPDITPAVKVA